VNNTSKLFHSRYTDLLQIQWNVLQLTLFSRYCTAGGQFYFRLNGVCFSVHYVEGTAQRVDICVAGKME